MGIRDEQKEKRRQEILVAALDLFIRNGYAATKVSDIARQVGMSAGLLFHYFESKEALYEELIRMGVAGPMGMMESPESDPLRFFERVTEQILEHLRTQPFVAKMFVLMGQAMYNEAAPQRVKDLLKGFDIYTPSIRLIRQGQGSGTIREGDPGALAIAFWCAIQGIAEQMAVKPDMPCPESSWIIDIIRRHPS